MVKAQVWRAQVGRVPLYLLDTNIEDNRPEDRDITDQLYGGDDDMRIRQEIMLGIGGIRALEALGLQPTVCHMNEGHSAFLALERIRLLMEEHQIFLRRGPRGGHRRARLHHPHAGAGRHRLVPSRPGGPLFQPLLSRTGPLAARVPGAGADRTRPIRNGYFCMAILAMRLANRTNGVSQLHARVSREMWQEVWPEVPADEVPILGITNGIHPRSWISHDMADLYDRYLGPRWIERPADQSIWRRVCRASPTRSCGAPTSAAANGWWPLPGSGCAASWSSGAAGPSEIASAEEVLDPEALTIGFARRFATYKRATLLFRDLERLARILGDRDRPVQIIFAGKAHPQDNPGKELIRQIIHHARRPEFRNRIVFIEDYDMTVARYLVQGVDVWLNTPRRPHEASGTSGMKATANGALEPEHPRRLVGRRLHARDRLGHRPRRGVCEDQSDYQDQVEANAIYDLLEKEIVPLFYRAAGGMDCPGAGSPR